MAVYWSHQSGGESDGGVDMTDISRKLGEMERQGNKALGLVSGMIIKRRVKITLLREARESLLQAAKCLEEVISSLERRG